MMDCCNEVDDFINDASFYLRNIRSGGIRCPRERCKNKKFLDPDVVTMHLQHNEFMEKYMCWFAHGKPYVPYETMVERMVGSTYRSNNVHGVVDNNSNLYKTMVMNVMRMNQSYIGECPIINEKPYVDVTKFFDLLKDSNEPLWDECTNHSKLSVIA